MFKTIKKCPLCGSKGKTKIIRNNKNIYSFFLSKILNLEENLILKNMQNYKCDNCDLIYKKKWIYAQSIERIYRDFQPTHPGGLNTLKKNFGKKKFLELINKYEYYLNKKDYDLSERKKREIIKILNSTNSNKSDFIKLKKKFIIRLNSDQLDFVIQSKLALSKMIDKPKIYSQFAGFRSDEVSKFFSKTINLKKISSYAEVGCPLWGNYNHFKRPWIKQFFIDLGEKNFWKTDKKINESCLKYLSKRVKVINRLNQNKIDIVGVYNFLDHLENPLKLFKKELKNAEYLIIICEDINLSKKIDCQHFSSWSNKSLKFLSRKIGYTILGKPFRLGNSIFKLYVLKKRKTKNLNT